MKGYQRIPAPVLYVWLIVLLLLACSCGGSMEKGRFYHSEKGFSIKFPEGWELVRGDGVAAPLVESVSPWEDDEDPFSEYISVDVEEFSKKITLGEMFDRMRKDQADEFQYFEVQETGDVKIGSEDSKYIVFDIGMEEGNNRVISYTLVNDKRGYLIACVAESGKFDEYMPVFREAVHTFKFE